MNIPLISRPRMTALDVMLSRPYACRCPIPDAVQDHIAARMLADAPRREDTLGWCDAERSEKAARRLTPADRAMLKPRIEELLASGMHLTGASTRLGISYQTAMKILNPPPPEPEAPTLTAPDHLKGSLGNFSKHVDERGEWMLNMVKEGFTQVQISEALGIRKSSTWKAILRHKKKVRAE